MGKDSAKKLIKQGHRVYTAARRIEKMKDIEELGGHPIKMDVSIESDVQSAVDYIIKKEGKIDVLWNNAGYGLYGAVENVTIEDAKKQFDVNLFGLANLTKKVVPFMRKEKSGTIINTSSMGGKMYTPLGAWYHATKHAVEGFSDCLRIELAPYNIKVVVLEPGLISTEFASVLYGPMVQNAKNTVYENITNQAAKATQDVLNNPKASSPTSVISNTISKIVNTNKPKTRYRVGKFAKPMVWMRTYLGDRIFDKILMSQFK